MIFFFPSEENSVQCFEDLAGTVSDQLRKSLPMVMHLTWIMFNRGLHCPQEIYVIRMQCKLVKGTGRMSHQKYNMYYLPLQSSKMSLKCPESVRHVVSKGLDCV